MRYPAYCPSHLAIHEGPWCTTGDHISLDRDDPAAEARRRGFAFFHGDVENLRDSAVLPLVGDVVGDRRLVIGGRFHLAYLREIVDVSDEWVRWKRPHGSHVTKTRRGTWSAWARGSWRCHPKTGEPTWRGWTP